MNQLRFILREFPWNEKQLSNVLDLLKEGATIPFISRYRKERSGGMDEVQVGRVKELGEQFEALIARQQSICAQIEEQGQLTPELKEKIETCFDKLALEDLYLPYKRKRQTKAEKARKAGLEPLARMLMSQRGGDPEQMASRFLKGEILSEDEAIDGALHIVAEWINETIPLRERLREQFSKHAVLEAKVQKGKETEGEVYKNYFNSSRDSNLPFSLR